MIMPCDFQQEPQFEKKMKKEKKNCITWLQRKEEQTVGEKISLFFSLLKQLDM